jgi:hypothetical protein
MQSLFEVKRPHNNVMSVTKHAIVTTLMNNGSITSMKQKTRLLKVHFRNITMVVWCRESMWFIGNFLWSLVIWKKRVDILALKIKAIVLAWWASKVRVNPNQKEVMRITTAFVWKKPNSVLHGNSGYFLHLNFCRVASIFHSMPTCLNF